MIPISQHLRSTTLSVYDFFQRPGVGLYIPIALPGSVTLSGKGSDLLEAIGRGLNLLIKELPAQPGRLHYLGTQLTVVPSNKEQITPLEKRGLPPTVEFLLGGGHQLAAIGGIATRMHHHMRTLLKAIPQTTAHYEALAEACTPWLEKLESLFAVVLHKGQPPLKPKIIYGQEDRWTHSLPAKEAYTSPLGAYLAAYIGAISAQGAAQPVDGLPLGTDIGNCLDLTDRWVQRNIINEPINSTHQDAVPPAKAIMAALPAEHLWEYERSALHAIVMGQSYADGLQETACQLVKLFAVCHFLLHRCCFTHLQPSTEALAEDILGPQVKRAVALAHKRIKAR